MLRWHLKQPPSFDQVDHVRRLITVGLHSVVQELSPHFQRVCADETLPTLLRRVAGQTAGQIRFSQQDYVGAIQCFEQALALPSSPADDPTGELATVTSLYDFLANASHYSGDSRTALTYLEKYREQMVLMGAEPNVRAGCLRFRAEIHSNLGEYEEALHFCEEALVLRRGLFSRGGALADTVFWKGMLLFRLERFTEAAVCIEEALDYWQETNNITGIGFCLRVMGQLHAGQGCFAEAQAHLSYAILLHEQANDQGSRLAAVEASADAFYCQGRWRDALPLYEERLADYEARQREESAARIRVRIEQCRLEGA